MTQHIQVIPILGLLDQVAGAKSGEALKASLGKLRAILNAVNDEVAATEGTAPTVGENTNMVEDILARLGPTLDAYMQTDPAKAVALTASLAPLLAEYAKGGDFAVAKVITALRPAITNYLLVNPNGMTEVIQLIAPLIEENSMRVMGQIELATRAFTQCGNVLKNTSEATFTKELNEKVVPVLVQSAQGAATVTSMYKQIRPKLERLHAKDPSKMQGFLNQLDPVLGQIAARNPAKGNELLEELLQDELLEQMYAASPGVQTTFFTNLQSHLTVLTTATPPSIDTLTQDPNMKNFLGNYQTGGTATSPDLSGALGTAMLYIQQFQVSLSQAQANQDKLTAIVGSAQIASAQALQVKTNNTLNQIAAEKAAAADRPWWEWLVIGLAAALGALLAGLTAGMGAALVAVAIGAFMASPLFNMAVQGIAKGLEDIGCPADVATILAKVIVTVIVVAFSFGAGSVTAAGDEAVDTAVAETGEEVTEKASLWSRFKAQFGKPNYVQGAKMAAFQGVSTLASSNIIMDFMMLNPTWVKNNHTLAAILDGICELVLIIASAGAGYKCLGGMMQSGEGFLDASPRLLRGIMLFTGSVQAGQGGMSAGMAFTRASILAQAAENTRILGALEGELTRVMEVNSTMSENQNANDTSASNITQGTNKEMDMLEQASGNIWSATSRVLTR